MKFLLFDLGGVLIKIDAFTSLQRLSGNRYSIDEMKSLWLNSKMVRLFESGRINVHDFSEGIIAELSLTITPMDFIKEFEKWPRNPYHGATDLLEQLRLKYPLGCLSNTNVIHHKKMLHQWNFLKYFDRCFFSHSLGCLKPDKEIFTIVEKTLPYKKEEIAFFDDTLENVQAAQGFGFNAYHVKGFTELTKLLNNILPE
ncbi:MAG: HAD family phosphatase [Spirochaetaceae bacterium]|jgi:HAD superfamily hydrolase (TIGR01509 family)|nr:HAD family phosphatase [Spirochaetaceae bacterium]